MSETIQILKPIPCPIATCQHKSRGLDTLFVHLMQCHKKNQIVETLLELLSRQLQKRKEA